jgi:HAD superfamily hydrolase (TIGR01509 family)
MSRTSYRALLFDVMGTLVYEPFSEIVPRALGMSQQELLAQKHPSAWVDFELGAIDEPTLRERFFADRREFDFCGMKRAMIEAYAWLEGIEPLLAELRERGNDLHLFSNYPVWYLEIEKKLTVSRYAAWTFVSCHMGARKPSPAAYRMAIDHFGVPPRELFFVDDRRVNCETARALGIDAVRFESAEALREQLTARGLL